MKIIKNCYETIGMFDTRMGDVFIIDNNIIIPVSNVQVDEGFELNNSKNIAIIDYSYFILINVSFSERDLYYTDFICHQINYQNPKIKYGDIFCFDLIDFKNPNFQYWNWNIRAEEFCLGILDRSKFSSNYWNNSSLEIDFFFNTDFLKTLNLEI